MQVKTTLKESLVKKLYMISFDLGNKSQNYDKIVAEIKKYPGWCKLWDNQWFICSAGPSDDICKKFQKVLNPSDFFFVCNVTADRMGMLKPNVVDWMQDMERKQNEQRS